MKSLSVHFYLNRDKRTSALTSCRFVNNMKTDLLRLDLLFDAEEYNRMGNCPWTFFAYPTSLSDEQGLPPDKEVCELLSRIQQKGIDVAIWVSRVVENTTYFACRIEDIQRLSDSLNDFESCGTNGFRLLSIRSESLFAQLADSRKKS